jgi:protein TonB
MKRTPSDRHAIAVFRNAGLWAGIATLVTGCSWFQPRPAPSPSASLPPPVARPATPTPVTPSVSKQARAANIQEYREEVAKHLYEHNAKRIYSGKMPPLLYAVGVLQTEIDARGQVANVSWMRAPSHAPEVMAEIERTVRNAAPYPAPVKLGRVTMTETWLWHKSGNFQLHTLSEGQY